VINGKPYRDEADRPGHACQVCDPNTSTTEWSPRDNDTICGTNPHRICCGGDCCPPDQCCSAAGLCEDCGCTIEELGGTGRAFRADNTRCGNAGDGVCCSGSCCPPGECCGAAGQCEACASGCEIDGVAYEEGARNPNNYCEICNSSRDATSWSSRDNETPCGRDAPQVCCNGVCCDEGVCCTADGTCDSGPCGCTIDDTFYPDATFNPENGCLYCAAFVNRTSWTYAGDNQLCGPFGSGSQVCCNEACCGPDECCYDGVCGPKRETICPEAEDPRPV
jgi:hypothetical protein